MIMNKSLGCWLLLLCSVCAAEQPQQAVPCQVINVHDGDTLTVDLILPFGITLRERSIRAYGYDAWEISRNRRTVKITANELVRGKLAKTALEQLIAEGKLFAEDSGERDPYGRTSARLWIQKDQDWINVATWMQEHGHCRK